MAKQIGFWKKSSILHHALVSSHLAEEYLPSKHGKRYAAFIDLWGISDSKSRMQL